METQKYYMVFATGSVYTQDEIKGLPCDEVDIDGFEELEEYSPYNPDSPCDAGYWRDGEYWRCHTKCGQHLEGASIPYGEDTRDRIEKLLIDMVG